ncbi:YndM family protein [Bacillus sp. FJAT-44742]|uniref:YndM family protein n=1 Tax=Bacillus sp. FJAT-44742 TaxID=2014005 RepID=UPI000C244B77|nr:YndM family protein [Bacillus sp. FJAT-44742]
MEHLKALGIKFVMVAASLFIVLGLWGVPIAEILITSLVLTAGAYLIGDLWVFPSFGNWTAAFADLGLAFAGIWIVGTLLFPGINLPLAALISAAVIAAGEYFFHKFMARKVLNNNNRHVREEAQRA